MAIFYQVLGQGAVNIFKCPQFTKLLLLYINIIHIIHSIYNAFKYNHRDQRFCTSKHSKQDVGYIPQGGHSSMQVYTCVNIHFEIHP